ncbi:MAG: T9SS type A sorting domain-containing protein [Bacteroidia bacterium]
MVVYDTISVEDTLNVYIATGVANPLAVEFKVYPNPVGDKLYISIKDYSVISNYNISITDVMGRLKWSSNVVQKDFTIDVADVGTEGLYFLNFYNSSAQLIERKVLVFK